MKIVLAASVCLFASAVSAQTLSFFQNSATCAANSTAQGVALTGACTTVSGNSYAYACNTTTATATASYYQGVTDCTTGAASANGWTGTSVNNACSGGLTNLNSGNFAGSSFSVTGACSSSAAASSSSSSSSTAASAFSSSSSSSGSGPAIAYTFQLYAGVSDCSTNRTDYTVYQPQTQSDCIVSGANSLYTICTGSASNPIANTVAYTGSTRCRGSFSGSGPVNIFAYSSACVQLDGIGSGKYIGCVPNSDSPSVPSSSSTAASVSPSFSSSSGSNNSASAIHSSVLLLAALAFIAQLRL